MSSIAERIEALTGQQAVFRTRDGREWTGTVDGVAEGVVHLRDARQAERQGTLPRRLSLPIPAITAWGESSTEGETS